LALSQLFVAMTRARDGLFLTCTKHPSPILSSFTTSGSPEFLLR
jgi:hypothetical protein